MCPLLWLFTKKTCKPENSGAIVGAYLGHANLAQGDQQNLSLSGRGMALGSKFSLWYVLLPPSLTNSRGFLGMDIGYVSFSWGSPGLFLEPCEMCEGKGLSLPSFPLSSGWSLGCKPLCHPHHKMLSALGCLCFLPHLPGLLSMYRKLPQILMGRQGSPPCQKDFFTLTP